MKLRTHPQVRPIFRACRDAGDNGLFIEQIAAVVGADPDSHSLHCCINSMCQRSYLTRLGHADTARWVQGLRMPEGESSEIGAGPTDSASALRKPFSDFAAEMAALYAAGAVTCVWDLARAVTGAELSMGGGS